MYNVSQIKSTLYIKKDTRIDWIKQMDTQTKIRLGKKYMI